LNLEEKRIDRVVNPKKLEATPGERPIFNLSTRIATGNSRLRGSPIDRRLVAPPLLPRPVQLYLIISGKQPFARAIIGDRKRDERRLEKAACSGVVLWWQGSGGLAQTPPVPHPSVVRDDGPWIERGSIRQCQKPIAGFEKGRDCRRNPVIPPSVKRGERNRREFEARRTRVSAEARCQNR